MKMNAKITGGLFGIALLLTAGLVNASTVRITPVNTNTSIGPTFNLTVEGFNFAETIGGGFTIGWDTSILQLVSTSTDIDDSLMANGFDTISIVPGTINPVTTNSLDILSSSFVNTFIGNFDIVTLTFQAVQTGMTNADLLLSPRQGSDWVAGDFFTALPVTYEGASVTVGAVPVPSAVWLFGSGLIGMVGIARRRKTQFA